MSQASRIEWTEATWNPTVGCTKISPGCKHCYAESMAKRLQAMGTPGYENGFKLTILPERLAEPLARKKPTVYFVNSMSDLFHKSVDDNYIAQVFDVIRRCPQHTFQVLTKRADRMASFFRNRAVPDNAWLGVSVEDRRYGVPRIAALRQVVGASSSAFGARAFERGGLVVDQRHGVAAGGKGVGDAGAHQSGADDDDGLFIDHSFVLQAAREITCP